LKKRESRCRSRISDEKDSTNISFKDEKKIRLSFVCSIDFYFERQIFADIRLVDEDPMNHDVISAFFLLFSTSSFDCLYEKKIQTNNVRTSRW